MQYLMHMMSMIPKKEKVRFRMTDSGYGLRMAMRHQTWGEG